MLFLLVAMILPEQAVAVAEKHHYSIIVVFVLGYILHAGLQVDAVARAKNNPMDSRIEILEQNWIRFTARLFVSLMLFLFMWHNPSEIPTILGYFGVTLGTTATALLTLPISPPVAGIFGFSADSLLAYIPILKNSLPSVDGPGNQQPAA